MSKTLRDPDLPPGAIVETFDDGGALRNDGVRLTPAAQNPWYVLATVAGEQEGTSFAEIDPDLYARTRRFWNGWMCQGMDDAARAEVARKMGLEPSDLAPLSEDEMKAVRQRFKAAFPDQELEDVLPDPSRSADFSQVHFPSTFVLGKCHFAGDAFFQAAHFAGDADFQEAHFAGGAFFRAAHFAGFALFSDGAFNAKTMFSDARFESAVPEFYQREMHQDTSFSDDPALWPKVTEKNAETGKQAYTRLRQIAAEAHNPDLEHFFLRQEMECKKELAPRFDKLFFRAYRLISEYGISVARPVVGLALTIGVGWPFIASFLKYGQGGTGGAPIWEGLGISFGNTLPFLGLVRKMHPDFYKQAPAWLDALSGVQSVAGILLLFFLGLGLRNRFRLK